MSDNRGCTDENACHCLLLFSLGFWRLFSALPSVASRKSPVASRKLQAATCGRARACLCYSAILREASRHENGPVELSGGLLCGTSAGAADRGRARGHVGPPECAS